MINFVVKVKWTLYEIMPIEIYSTEEKKKKDQLRRQREADGTKEVSKYQRRKKGAESTHTHTHAQTQTFTQKLMCGTL